MHKTLRNLPSLDFLRGFEAAGRRLSFTLAAEELFLTQSALSRQVKALEDALGVPLFERAMPAREERHAEGVLEGLDLTRQRRLRQEQLFGGERERQATPGGLEAAEKVQRRQPAQRLIHALKSCDICGMNV